jgi:hypothetical protein
MRWKDPRRSQLEVLCGGYLHQDFMPVHGSAVQAVQAFLAESDEQDAIDVSSEWRAFLNVTSGMDHEARARALRELAGGAWAPASASEFDAVSELLLDAWRR